MKKADEILKKAAFKREEGGDIAEDDIKKREDVDSKRKKFEESWGYPVGKMFVNNYRNLILVTKEFRLNVEGEGEVFFIEKKRNPKTKEWRVKPGKWLKVDEFKEKFDRTDVWFTANSEEELEEIIAEESNYGKLLKKDKGKGESFDNYQTGGEKKSGKPEEKTSKDVLEENTEGDFIEEEKQEKKEEEVLGRELIEKGLDKSGDPEKEDKANEEFLIQSIGEVQNFDELYDVIEVLNGLQDSDKDYQAADLISLIDNLRKGTSVELDSVPEIKGLRKKVFSLLKEEREKKRKAENYTEKNGGQGEEKNIKEDFPIKPEDAINMTKVSEGRYEYKSKEELRLEADKIYEELLESQRRYNRAKRDNGKLKNILKMLKGTAADAFRSEEEKFEGAKKRKEEKIQVREEFEEAKKTLEDKKNNFRKAFGDYTKALVNEKEAGFLKNASSKDSEDYWKQVRNFISGEKIIEVSKKEGQIGGEDRSVEKVSIIEEYNRRILDLSRQGFEGKNKTILDKVKGAWDRIPKKKKVLIMAAIFGTTSVLTGSIAGIASSAATIFSGGENQILNTGIGAGAKIARKGLIIGATAFLLGYGSKKVIDYLDKRDEEKTLDEMAKGFSGEKNEDIFLKLDEKIKRDKKRNRAKLIAALGTGVAIAGATNFIINDEFADVISGKASSSSLVPDEVSSGRPEGGGIKIDKDDFEGKSEGAGIFEGKMEGENSGSTESAFRNGIDAKETGENGKLDKGILSTDKENLEKKLKETFEDKEEDAFGETAEADVEGEIADKTLKLGEGGSVWGVLEKSDYFDGDQTKVANALADFKKETAKGLMEKHGMSSQQADEYMKWRFKRMQPTDVVAIKSDGNIEITDFENEKMINRFRVSQLAEKLENDSAEPVQEKIIHKAPEFVSGKDNLIPEDVDIEEAVRKYYPKSKR